MNVLVIGGHGTIGRKVVERLQEKHNVIIAGRTAGDVLIDIADIKSIEEGLSKLDALDAIICAAGEARWNDFNALSEDDYYVGIRSKLMGQVNLVRIGKNYLKNGGSITLSTGVLADIPVLKTTSAAMVNGAIHSFVKAVDLEIENQIRVNVVSLGLVEDAYEKYKDYFPGHNPIPMHKAVNVYIRSIEGSMRGQILRYYDYE